ncbi:DUF1700 domain-containing protein [Aerococcus sp. UMB7834]|uniref:DUF1700 domain-containing protein n=1 Tax=Aerococcus sp. UMB7834 TaxID=3046342 RepID=UPI00254D1D06|nr:DUF1700 domain-containing protein [Aerococcus sp. UMB7834]MDK6805745.1 DUF1700 domain-containing protein [Aerococcus sp. UMB7834]
MRQEEFLDLLTYYLRRLPDSVIADIRQDYLEHYEMGLAQGKSEEEISQELGSPREIAVDYLDNERVFIDEEGALALNEEKRPRKLHWFWKLVLFLAALPFILAFLSVVFSLLVSVVSIWLAIILTAAVLGTSVLVSVFRPDLFNNGVVNIGLVNDLSLVTKLCLAIFLICLTLLLIYSLYAAIRWCIRGLMNAWYAFQWRRKRGAY